MSNEILLAIIQASTEFLPVSSSGHLALVSNLINTPNLFLITILHLASLLAVLVFTRKEIFELMKFNKKANKTILYLIIATIPAALFGFFFRDLIEITLNSYLIIGTGFIFTGFILLSTKFAKNKSFLTLKGALVIGLFQMMALFPGVSRSGMTISAALFIGINKEKATKFSFLLFIPLAIGATILEIGNAYFTLTLLIAFVICFVLSLIFLNILYYVIQKEKLWVFSIYCFGIGLTSLGLYIFR